jgi:hypothetical protein
MFGRLHIRIPGWAASLYVGASLVLVPWTVYIGNTLNTRHVFRHWDVAWVGFDIALTLSLLFTGISAYKKSPLVIVAGAISGSMLVMDAWFDVLGARPGHDLALAVAAAFIIEIPLAYASFGLAYDGLRELAK